MQCPGCLKMHTVHSWAHNWSPDKIGVAPPCHYYPKCALGCGDPAEPPDHYMPGKTRDTMAALGCCYRCAHWELAARKPNAVVIDNYLYGICSEPRLDDKGRPLCRDGLGMAGRKFVILFFAGPRAGETVVTHNLWGGGEVPTAFRDHIPNTAKFGGGAEWYETSGITGWNPSK